MSVLNPNSDEEPQECPLCLEPFEIDDLNFFPCSCGYQICRFCWNKIRTEGSGNCPACRSPYSENPADFKPLTAEELAKIKAEKRQKDLAKKQRISENRKHLANVRVVQRNLVFVVGLSPRLADPDVLKKPEYFGRFGRIHKVVINTSTTYAGNQNQGPSASAYVTYYKSEDALRAIQAVNNVVADGRTLKASLGTTKYCSHFMKNMTCPKHDCMYLHELGDEAASFTKEEMQQGKHTEYEKNLHDELSLSSAQQTQPQHQQQQNLAALEPSSSPSTFSSATPGGPFADHMAASTGPPGLSTNGRAASENSDKLSSRTPSPPNNQIINGGWPNLAVDLSKKRQYDLQQRSKSPPLSSNLGESLVNGHMDAYAPRQMQQQPPVPELLHVVKQDNANSCDSGWGSALSKDSYKDGADIFEEDDLGFDPFHETQKGLAEMLESESKQVAALQQRHMIQQQQYSRQTNDSPPLHESPVMNRNPGFLGRPMNNDHFGSTSSSSGNGRVKQPPPGFDPLSLLSTGSNGQQSTQRNLLSPEMGLLNLEALTSQLNLNGGFGHQNELGRSGSRNDSGNGFGGHMGPLSNHHQLHNGILGLKSESSMRMQQQQQQQSFFMEKQHQQHQQSKDWQDGLRALLPNVNVSFGALPHTNGTDAGGRMFQPQSQGLLNEHQHPHERMQRHHQQHRSGWNSIKNPHNNDWTSLDPAIVTGQVSDHLSHNLGLRADSPPGWLKSNLEQLTSSDNGGRFGGLNGSNGGGLVPGLAGLGLGGGQQQQQLGHWGQPSPVMSNTPPPGFALNRGQMGMQPSASQPHPFSALAGLGASSVGNANVDREAAHIESELARLVRS